MKHMVMHVRPYSVTPSSTLTQFAICLAKKLSEGDEGSDNNLVFSPLSIYVALALVAVGADGKTLDEFLALLGAASREELAEFVRGMAESALADRSGSGGPLIAFACGLWHKETELLKPAYRSTAVESYKAETHAANFLKKSEEVRKEINNWVSTVTKNLIPTILPEDSVHSSTVLVLANAIYFKGTWCKPFAENKTKEKKFYCLDGSHVRAPFMHSKEKQFVKEHDGFKVLKLPYRNTTSDVDVVDSDECPRFSMCVFLPDARDGLPGLIDKMASSSSSFMRDHMPKRRVKLGKFRLPKFKLSFSNQMKETLMAMDLEAVFFENKANLSNMLEDDDGLFMEHVFHKAVIEVNEEGTEAAASTTCTFLKKGKYLDLTDFVADHPFVFFLVEEVSGAVIFMGHVLDPTRSE
ncbi:unnamed protein product [Urochloa humidicola]